MFQVIIDIKGLFFLHHGSSTLNIREVTKKQNDDFGEGGLAVPVKPDLNIKPCEVWVRPALDTIHQRQYRVNQ